MERDELFEEAARLFVENKIASTSYLQRKLILGYNRANRITDQLEHYGIIGKFDGRSPRQVLFHRLEDLNEFLEKIR